MTSVNKNKIGVSRRYVYLIHQNGCISVSLTGVASSWWGTLGRLILVLVKFCDFEIFRFGMYFNLANSWKISELEKWFLTWHLASALTHASN